MRFQYCFGLIWETAAQAKGFAATIPKFGQ